MLAVVGDLCQKRGPALEVWENAPKSKFVDVKPLVRRGHGAAPDRGAGNANNFTFPGTRKALASFPGVADIRLVEIREGGRRLGVEVKSKEQGEALIAHVKATMKDENPILICHAPSKPRVIELKEGK